MAAYPPIQSTVNRASASALDLGQSADAVLVAVVASNANAAAKTVTFADGSGTRFVLTVSPASNTQEIAMDLFMVGGLVVTNAHVDLDVIVKWRTAV